jgi:probable rRNA maturation factor
MDPNIEFNFVDSEIPDFNSEFFCLWLTHCASLYGKVVGNLCYVFCTDDYLLNMNKEHLDHDYYTDIITFNYNEGNSLSGDLFISVDRVRDNAKQLQNNVYDELCRVMVHGLLHLVGFDDISVESQQEMTQKENQCLELRNSFT